MKVEDMNEKEESSDKITSREGERVNAALSDKKV